MNVFSMRTAVKSDIDFVMQIEEKSFSSSIKEERKIFLKRINLFANGFLIFEHNFKPAGYLSSELWQALPQNEKEFSLSCGLNHGIESVFALDGKILYISSFAILPEFRGKGSGFSMFSDALNYFERTFDLTDFVLTVNEEWNGARRIYDKCGFREVFKVRKMFENSAGCFSDGIFMRKSIAK
ncbi:MAG: GNAT family N-acetyltransferase [Treponema sp.]